MSERTERLYLLVGDLTQLRMAAHILRSAATAGGDESVKQDILDAIQVVEKAAERLAAQYNQLAR